MSDYAIVAADEVQDVEPVESWAVSRSVDRSDATKIDDFWPVPPTPSSIATLMRDLSAW